MRTPFETMSEAAERVGVRAISIPSGRVLFEYRPNDPLTPASLVKLLTSYAALKVLGPGHRFSTSVRSTAGPRNGEVPGDIWIESEGDIHLTTRTLRTLVTRMKDLGIRTVRGGVYADGGFFRPDAERICLDANCRDACGPVVSGTSLAFNAIAFYVTPGPEAGTPLHVEWTPPGDYVELENLGTTGSEPGGAPLTLVSLGITGDGRERYRLSGSLPVHAKAGQEFPMTANDPSGFAARTFKCYLGRAGVRVVSAAAMAGTLPSGAKKLASCESAPLGDLLYGLNRYSNNFMAEMLLRDLGARAAGPPGSAEKGLTEVAKMLASLGVPEREFRLDTGSGLSRVCCVSPRTFCRVLETARSDPILSAAFLRSLAVNGQSGTLRDRLCSSVVEVRGKTGTLGDVVAFAGYVSAPGKETAVVAAILNGVRDVARAKAAVDSFLEETAFRADGK